jgi:exosortase/archaeosortase family protein
MKNFLIKYLVLVGIGLLLLPLPFLSPAIDFFCQGLAHISFYMARLFSSAITLENNDTLRYQVDGFAIVVSHACSGLSSVWLLSAAILVFPTSWKFKGIVILFCIFAIQGLNLLRLINLVYVGQFHHAWFDTVHEQLWPLFLHFVSLICFGGWLTYLSTESANHAPA